MESPKTVRMESHCLNHPGRNATKRCVSCLKPLCDECTQLFSGGIYCSERCHEAALQAQERAETIARADKELKDWQQKRLAFKLIGTIALVAFLFFGWEFFPDSVTSKVEAAWHWLTTAFR